ncbi:MAG: hypothetical protein Q8P88_02125 [Candidatus Jorgensenbacteria bacterium]|nr:hypothetical protein [Candidatus Jorgensenbacteria bacterium]
MKFIIKFFDELEDRVRARLSRHPVVYALISGLGIVLFFRGVWMAADVIAMPWEASLLVSLILLLVTGAFALHFVSEQLVVSGLKREKKMIERTEEEVREETGTLKSVKAQLDRIEKTLEELKRK